jgi:hypothetical protein
MSSIFIHTSFLARNMHTFLGVFLTFALRESSMSCPTPWCAMTASMISANPAGPDNMIDRRLVALGTDLA